MTLVASDITNGALQGRSDGYVGALDQDNSWGHLYRRPFFVCDRTLGVAPDEATAITAFTHKK